VSLECYGRLDKVFPLGPDGLRHSPEECLACPDKVDCLKTALASPQGAVVERGGVGPAQGLGRLVKGLGRWSRLKAARQRESM